MTTRSSPRWLNWNFVAIGATSLLTDASHGSATTAAAVLAGAGLVFSLGRQSRAAA